MPENNSEQEPRFISERGARMIFHPASVFVFLGIALFLAVGVCGAEKSKRKPKR